MNPWQIAALSAPSVLAAAVAGLALFTRHTARRVEAALPPQGRFVEAGGINFHVHEQGQGPSLLLIHGFCSARCVISPMALPNAWRRTSG